MFSGRSERFASLRSHVKRDGYVVGARRDGPARSPGLRARWFGVVHCLLRADEGEYERPGGGGQRDDGSFLTHVERHSGFERAEIGVSRRTRRR